MQLLVLIVLAGLVTPVAGQSTTSIQGVWRVVERTIPASTAERRDPFGTFSEGTHTNLQPELLIFTAQVEKNFTRLSIKLDGNNLWLTPMGTETGNIAAPVTSKYMRVE